MKYDSKPGNASVGYYRQFRFNDRSKGEPLRALTEEDWDHWKTNGFVVMPNVVPKENIDRLVELIWEFEEKDPSDPATWYKPPLREIEMVELRGSGMVELYNHQYLWDNRQYPKVYDIFVDIWGTEHLWVSIDRANLNFPVKDEGDFKGFIHWDIDTSDANRRNNVQGVLSLTETTAETGGFQCVPDLYRTFDQWVETQPSTRNPFMPDVSEFSIVQVETKPGDLLIWDSMLAHGIRFNRSNRPRVAQYIAMTPAQEDNEELRQWRIRSWRERIPPEGYAFPGDPRKWEQKHSEVAQLTELGERLLGLKKWKEVAGNTFR